jgi:bifunctional DNA-binding transcriptional regulator/antitoxin component of YhaV-PrlF toxin-antitoxin module
MELVKVLDKWGRLVVPKVWRKKYARNGLVLLKVEGDKIIIEPYELPDLTRYFDSIEVDLKSDLTDWKAVKRELFNTR